MDEIIQYNFHQVLERIGHTARRSGRDPEDIKLVVVTKGQPLEKIRAVLAAGAWRLCENYIEEAIPKIEELKQEAQVEWHMIGHIQSRKAGKVCEYFDWAHSLDSLKLAGRMDRFAKEFNRQIPIMLEFNVSGEETKSGYPAWDKSMWPGLVDEVEAIIEFQNLLMCGLMVMPPFDPDPETARPFFARGRDLRDYLCLHVPNFVGQELSMGMSNDFEIAVQEGATIVRIVQAILGERKD